MLKVLEDFDWREAFGFAGEPSCSNTGTPELANADDPVSVDPFTREDVKRVIKHRDGENDGDSWLMVGELNDGRFFALKAECDYTGWD